MAHVPVLARGMVAIGALFFVMASCLGAPSKPAPGHGLALLSGGHLAGWGANEFGQVQAGQGDFLATPQRLQLPGAKPVAVAAGSRHSLAVDEAGKIWAWGDNSSGQLGLGHTRPAAGLSMVTGLSSRALAVAAGAQHSAALLADGSVWVWGANNRGQLGRGAVNAFAVETRPARVSGLADALALAAGDDFVVALVGKRSNSRSRGSKGGDVKSIVWGWGAGNGLPHPIDGVEAAAALRAAGDVAITRTSAGSYRHWRMDQLPPTAVSRQAFERLGEMTHPMLGRLAALAKADAQPRLAKVDAAMPKTVPDRAVAEASAPVAVPVAAVPMSALAPVTVPAQAPAPSLPATVLAIPPPAPAATPAPARVSVSGTVRLSSGFGGDSPATAGTPLENVQVAAAGAQCSSTDSQGRYVCNVAAGWSGRISVQRNNYQLSPSARSFQNLRVDADQQNFAAIYDPR